MEPSPQTTGSKYCPQCEKDKPLKEFGTNKSRGDGKQAYCKICTRENARVRRGVRQPLVSGQPAMVTSERTTRITFPPET